jgi:transcriptional regulator with XRE-family HTH domain
MSPFAYHLRKIRSERQLQQKALAELIGCEQIYLCALETDAKVPPQGKKLLQLIKKLKLSPVEETELLFAAEKSKRLIRLPQKGSIELFEICHELEEQLPNISDIQLKMIGLALQFKAKEMGATKM